MKGLGALLWAIGLVGIAFTLVDWVISRNRK